MRAFTVNWDYRCPFARNAHEHVVAALQAGTDWQVTFVGFSLDQAHVPEGEPDVWADPAATPGLLAMQVGVAVRDAWPASFLAVHEALFRARHDEGRDLRDEGVLRQVLAAQGVDADAVLREVHDGWPLETLRKEHERSVADDQVFGVPTFLVDGQAVFVRLMDRPGEDGEAGRRTVERVLDLATGWPELNELKHTSIPR